MKCHYCANDVSPLSMVSKFMCKYCRANRKKNGCTPPIIPVNFENPNPPAKNYKQLRGWICEDFIGNKMSMAEIGKKHDVSRHFISNTLSMYLDNSKPINLTFKPNE